MARDAENTKLIKTAREVNNLKTVGSLKELKWLLPIVWPNWGAPKIACFDWRLSLVDDLRGSPALHVALTLGLTGMALAVEPNIESMKSPGGC